MSRFNEATQTTPGYQLELVLASPLLEDTVAWAATICDHKAASITFDLDNLLPSSGRTARSSYLD